MNFAWLGGLVPEVVALVKGFILDIRRGNYVSALQKAERAVKRAEEIRKFNADMAKEREQ